MSSRNLELYLDDILASIQKIERYTINMTFDSFVADERTFDAVAHNLSGHAKLIIYSFPNPLSTFSIYAASLSRLS